MEFMNDMIRTLTPNGLIMVRFSDFLENLPDNFKGDVIETDFNIAKNLKLFKELLDNIFKCQDMLHF